MKNFVLLLVLGFPLFLFAQNPSQAVTPDQRLIEAYGQEYIQKLVIENPFLIHRWNYYLDHAFIIRDEVPGKVNDHPVVHIDDLKNINILKLEKDQKLNRDWDKPTIYTIKDTGKMLIYHSGKDFNIAMKTHFAEN